MKPLPKVIVVVGPTAVGKSDLAVKLALAVSGEVISADSRQVFTGLDIGTGKITSTEMQGVPHHLLDVTDPSNRFSVADFQVRAKAAIMDIISRGNVPIICGGTGFYIDAVLSDSVFPDAPADQELRDKLMQRTEENLYAELKERDPRRAAIIDQHNKVKLVRALEIVEVLGTVPEVKKTQAYDALIIGLTLPITEIRTRIAERLERRLASGMVEEAESLLKKGLSHERMHALGLEYRYLSLYLQKLISYDEMRERLALEIGQYARRQLTWFRRNKSIIWLSPSETDKALSLARTFLDN